MLSVSSKPGGIAGQCTGPEGGDSKAGGHDNCERIWTHLRDGGMVFQQEGPYHGDTRLQADKGAYEEPGIRQDGQAMQRVGAVMPQSSPQRDFKARGVPISEFRVVGSRSRP